MEVSIINQIYTLIYSIVLGFFFGGIYDIIRIFRIFLGINYVNRFTERLSQKKLKLIKNPIKKREEKSEKYTKIVLFITDFFYFILITPVFAIFLYAQCNGILRWYSIFGVILGFCVYYFTIGRLIISISEYIVFIIKAIILYLIFFLSRPFAPVVKFIKSKAVALKSRVKMRKKRKKEEKAPKRALITLYQYGRIKEKSPRR